MKLKDKKILVTGGLGFIGSHFCQKLKKLDANVRIFDIGNGDDIEDPKKLEDVISKKFDIIYHLAGFSGPSESNKNIKKSFGINTFSTVDLCELILKYSPKSKLILSSSRLEYGKPKYLPVDEEHPTNPISAYGLSKLAATQMALVYNKRYGLNVTIFRTSNVYGSHKKKQFPGYNIINDFIDKAKEGEALTIYGDGNQERDYIYVSDLVEAFAAAACQNISTGQIYNLGYGKGIKFKDMVSLISNKVGKGEVKFVPWPKSYKDVETGSYISDISKIKKQLGFSPKIGFEEGIVKTIQAQR